MRLAWFSPFPPVRTGIAGCSAELVAALAAARLHRRSAIPKPRAHDFPWRHRLRPYDLVVYQFGNSSHHDYEWAYALQLPGPGRPARHAPAPRARRASCCARSAWRDYRAEFAWNHPDVSPDAAELAVAGFDSRAVLRLADGAGAGRGVAAGRRAWRRRARASCSSTCATCPTGRFASIVVHPAGSRDSS